MAAINFNVNELPDGQDFSPVPAGDYNATIDEVTVHTTKAGDGQYFKLKLKLDNNRVIFGNLNIRNPSATAEAIGLGQLKTILQALKMQTLTDTDQLIGGRVNVTVAIKPASGEYQASNEVKSYRAEKAVTAEAPKSAPFGQKIPNF
jgi:hypothetical protein